MSQIDRQLEHLLRSAAKAPVQDCPPLSYATQTRTLAAWRAARANALGSIPLQSLQTWRAGLAAAFAAATLAVGLSFAANHQFDSELSDPYFTSEPGVSVALNTGWLP
jgi:hypothetical protein